MEKFLEWSSANKNKIFLYACLVIHFIYVGIFIPNKCWELAIVNLASVIFYITAIIILKVRKNASTLITLSYFEILIFSVLSEFIAGGHFGFILFTVGMVAVIFYLLPNEYSSKRYLIQFIGVLATAIIFVIDNLGIVVFPHIQRRLMEISLPLRTYNTVIAVGTVVYVSCLYMRELDKTRAKLHHNVNHDMLTGLYNRRFFEETMREKKNQLDISYAIVMFDIDDFKKVNDTYGHETGDRVIECVARCLKKNMGENDIAVRWGGEEFVLFFPNVDTNFAERKTIQIQNDIRRSVIECQANKVCVTTTAGIAVDVDIKNYENVIRIADERLYYGKRHGKNCHIKEDIIEG